MVIAINTTCHYCSEGVPFYNELAEMHSNPKDSTAIIAVFPSSSDQVKSYVEQQQLKIPTLAAIDFKSLNVTATPTVILIDNTGRVHDFWVGKLSKDEEYQVIQAAGLF